MAVRGAASAGPTTSVDTSSTASDKGQNLWLMLPLAGVAAAALPALLQPPLSGDTLIYHLPNAAAWARAALSSLGLSIASVRAASPDLSAIRAMAPMATRRI